MTPSRDANGLLPPLVRCPVCGGHTTPDKFCRAPLTDYPCLTDCIERVEALSKLYQADSGARSAFVNALADLRAAAAGMAYRRGMEDAARIAEELGRRFEIGAEKFETGDPRTCELMEERAGGCYQSAHAIRAAAEKHK